MVYQGGLQVCRPQLHHSSCLPFARFLLPNPSLALLLPAHSSLSTACPLPTLPAPLPPFPLPCPPAALILFPLHHPSLPPLPSLPRPPGTSTTAGSCTSRTPPAITAAGKQWPSATAMQLPRTCSRRSTRRTWVWMRWGHCLIYVNLKLAPQRTRKESIVGIWL